MRYLSKGLTINLIAFGSLILPGCNDESPKGLDSGLPAYLDNASYISYNINPVTQEGVELGRYLFYEKRLSKDNTMSCASCHIQELAFSDGKTKANGVNGNELLFNSMSLTNVAISGKLFWDGRGKSLELQALAPVVGHLEMDQRLSATVQKLENTTIYPRLFRKAFGNEKITPKRIAYAIAQFEKTLISFNSKYDQYLNNKTELTPLEHNGMNLFFTIPDPKKGIRGAGCVSCHLPVTFAGSTKNYEGFKNNGLNSIHYKKNRQGRQRLSHNNEDYGKFKVPTLRNIEVTGPYMHDGRFRTLEDVLNHYSDEIKSSSTLDSLIRVISNNITGSRPGLFLTVMEKKALIAFLKTLTDQDFLTNPVYSDPNKTSL